jgi:hypothetical protein
MLEYLLLLVELVRTALRSQGGLVTENLLLRHQLAVLTRPTRKRSRLRAGDRFIWVVACRLWRDWPRLWDPKTWACQERRQVRPGR